MSETYGNDRRFVTGLVSIIIPVYNERESLEELFQRVERVSLGKEIILIDDGSTDGTRDIVARLGDENRARVHLMPKNQGKGMAVRRGLEMARGEVCITQDADLEYDPAEIPEVAGPILAGVADVCYGSRNLGGNDVRSSFAFYWGGRLVSWLTTLLFLVHVTDETTGYKAFRTELLCQIPLRGRRFELEPELTAKVMRRGLRYKEVPISYHPRKFSQGKKIRWWDGVAALWTLLVWRILPF